MLNPNHTQSIWAVNCPTGIWMPVDFSLPLGYPDEGQEVLTYTDSQGVCAIAWTDFRDSDSNWKDYDGPISIEYAPQYYLRIPNFPTKPSEQ